MATPRETIASLRAKVAILEGSLRACNTILDSIAQMDAYEEPEKLILLSDSARPASPNPQVVVSITINGKGIKSATTFRKEDVEEAGWPVILAQACMEPVGLLARDMAK